MPARCPIISPWIDASQLVSSRARMMGVVEVVKVSQCPPLIRM